jgi:hypothetical protein
MFKSCEFSRDREGDVFQVFGIYPSSVHCFFCLSVQITPEIQNETSSREAMFANGMFPTSGYDDLRMGPDLNNSP